MFGLSRIQIIIIGVLLVVACVGGAILYVFNKGVKFGTAEITTEVQKKTIETLDAARKAKEQADQDTRAKPYGERVDGLK